MLRQDLTSLAIPHIFAYQLRRRHVAYDVVDDSERHPDMRNR